MIQDHTVNTQNSEYLENMFLHCTESTGLILELKTVQVGKLRYMMSGH